MAAINELIVRLNEYDVWEGLREKKGVWGAEYYPGNLTVCEAAGNESELVAKPDQLSKEGYRRNVGQVWCRKDLSERRHQKIG